MTIEHARAHSTPKPWGVVDARPWFATTDGIQTIGEIWYERSNSTAAPPSLLLKLLFTNEPLSIQVHPDDAYAQSIGLPNGKTEAWYVLSAAPGAKVALGLKQHLTSQQLRNAIDDGSISDLVAWQAVHTGDTTFVPAGTIHAIGAGLIIAEIQQRSDTTFRLFDHGRGRALNIDGALAVADAGPASICVTPRLPTDFRTLLISNPYFTFERIDLAPASSWQLEARGETWLLAISGNASVGQFDVITGDAIFAELDCINIRSGKDGLVGLVAYAGGIQPHMLKRVDKETAQ
jgi:mannose-6-phosphate isomerase